MTVFTWSQAQKYTRLLTTNSLLPETAPNDTLGAGCGICVSPVVSDLQLFVELTYVETASGVYDITIRLYITNNTAFTVTVNSYDFTPALTFSPTSVVIAAGVTDSTVTAVESESSGTYSYTGDVTDGTLTSNEATAEITVP